MLKSFVFLLFLVSASSYDWQSVDKILSDAVYKTAVFPGCSALVADRTGILYQKSFGRYTYSETSPQMSEYSMFDMASLTKVTGTLSAVAQFYQRGELPLETRVSDILGPEFSQNGKENITILNCLLHNAGFPPDPNPFYNTVQFGCPETANYHPKENFSCRTKIYNSFLSQTLENPIGSTYVYSDLSFITLHFAIGRLAQTLNYVTASELYPGCAENPIGISQCYFEAYVRKYVFQFLKLDFTGYLVPQIYWQLCAPTENDTSYMHQVIQGQVSDPNTYAMGGISGHAGLFSTTSDMYKYMDKWMFPAPQFLNKTTVDFFIKEFNHSQSSRALGWNTNDPTVYDQGWNNSCGTLSPQTYMHLGYTGGMLCGDPVRQLIVIILDNRVYPTAANIKIRDLRPAFATEVQKVYDLGNPQLPTAAVNDNIDPAGAAIHGENDPEAIVPEQ